MTVNIELDGISVILTLLFAVLKLAGIFTWSWWWVFSPIWIPIFILLVVGLFL